MEFKTHPILKEFRLNEDGTIVFYKEKQLEVKVYQKKGRDNYPYKVVSFRGQTYRLARLICECWNGMADQRTQKTRRKDFNPNNDHYTNLYWGSSNNVTKRRKRGKHSKIKEADIQDILDRIERNEPLAMIAADYGTSDMSIYRIKKNFLSDKFLILKRKIIKAHDGHGRRLAYAQYLNFSSIQEAIDKMGRKQFIKQCNQLMI